jgi:hypothetical protein
MHHGGFRSISQDKESVESEGVLDYGAGRWLELNILVFDVIGVRTVCFSCNSVFAVV